MSTNSGLFKKGHKQLNTGITHFKKGIPSWNKGKKLGPLTQEWKTKISNKLKGIKRIPFTEEHKRKIGESLKGKPHFHSEETRKKLGLAQLGKKHPTTDEAKIKISNALKGKRPKNNSSWLGENHPNWKGGITPINQQIRHSLEYKLWRTAVFERDNYICIWCGERGGELHADHIKPFADYPELRFAIDNGRTLCRGCHKTTETYGGRRKGI